MAVKDSGREIEEGADVPKLQFRWSLGNSFDLDPAASSSNVPRDSLGALVTKHTV